ncbi:YceI family protein [Moheibacter lacus]|uniref:YceI family protein n=1 Tax=Moheibacter lacus TaxID=2745851 RepID=A0A838ZRK1_9FLAO|nr:YceI family protein [Moheibacter lacus]MBA5629013.1 YceI family protein [Moheibacter lacus]
MKKVLLGLSFVGMAFLASCGPKDTVEATEAQDSASASAESVAYALNTDISSVTWKGGKIFEDTSKPEEGHYGVVKLKSGEVTVKGGVLESGKFVADQTTFESADLNEDAESKVKLDGHLKSADFLDVEKFPEATFEVTAAKALTEGDYNTEISGNLDFRGVPKNITFKANVTEEGDKVTIKSEEFKINRQDFGITFKGGGGSIIKDDVILQVDLSADKKM